METRTLTICEFCGRRNADAARIIAWQESEGAIRYICSDFDALEEYERTLCGCSRFDFNCGHPNCLGQWS